MASQTHLFQYGSNMNKDRLAAQIRRFARVYAPPGVRPEVSFLGAAELRGWRFAVDLYSAGNGCRVSNIVRQEAASVWGALSLVSVGLVRRSDRERSVLDRIEGHRTRTNPENYEPIEIAVQVDETERVAWTYVGLDEARERCASGFADAPVSDDHRRVVLDGAAAVGLPATYIAGLLRTLSGTADELAAS
jgi:hypothetical protein